MSFTKRNHFFTLSSHYTPIRLSNVDKAFKNIRVIDDEAFKIALWRILIADHQILLNASLNYLPSFHVHAFLNPVIPEGSCSFPKFAEANNKAILSGSAVK